MTDFAAVDRSIARRLQASLEELRHLVALPSVSADGTSMPECAALVAELLTRRGFQARLVPSAGFPVVFAERPGARRDRTLLFYNHYDVQPSGPSELWESPAFELDVRNECAFGRGAVDDKGHIINRLAALDALLETDGDLPCTVKFIIEGDEEGENIHLPEFVARHADLLAADACLWEAGGVNHEGVPECHAGLRGIAYVELRVRTASQDAHSGLGGSIFPNAAWRLVWALRSLKGPDERILLPGFYDRVRPPTPRDLELLAELPEDSEELRRTYGLQGFIKGLTSGIALRSEAVFSPTCTICGLTSGYQGPGCMTVLPAQASAKVDFRLVPDQDPAEVLAQLRKHFDSQGFTDIEIIDLGCEAPGRSDPDHPFLRLVADAAIDVYGRRQLIAPMTGGSGPYHAFIQHLGVPIATAGIGYPGMLMHAPNEHFRIPDFVAATRHVARVVARFAEMGAAS
jgi:acetylornithine deacetylase/succinyl-diaminopimelate desuccinylase-like protein